MTRALTQIVPVLATIGCAPLAGPAAHMDSGTEPSEPPVLVVSPDHVVLPVGSTTRLEAIGLTEDRSQVDLTAAADWSSSAPEVAEVGDGLDEEGVVFAVATGVATVSASLEGGPPAEVRVEVTDATLERLWIDSSALVIEAGDEVRLRALAAFSDGSGGDVTRQVRWVVEDPSIARVQDGWVEAVGVGTTELQVEWADSTSETVVVSVFPAGALTAPDLVVTAVDGCTRGGQARLEVTVENRGESTASGFFVDVWEGVEDAPAVGGTGDGYAHVSGLGPGASKTVELSWETAQRSTEVTALVDSADNVLETAENNNVAYGELIPAPPGADLRIVWFGFHGSGDALTYEVEVQNTGDETAHDVEVSVWTDRATAPRVGSTGDETVVLDALEPWERTMLYLQPGAPACRSCTSWALVDSRNRVSEPDEEDNLAGPLTVTP